jgi:hypothetical protein
MRALCGAYRDGRSRGRIGTSHGRPPSRDASTGEGQTHLPRLRGLAPLTPSGTAVRGAGAGFGVGRWTVGTGTELCGDGNRTVASLFDGLRTSGSGAEITDAVSGVGLLAGFHAAVEWQSAHVVGNREWPGNGLVS